MYTYTFDKEECWYKNSCKLYNTKECKNTCVRYMKMHYLMNNSLLTKLQQKPKQIIIDDKNIDLQAYFTLNKIKLNIANFVKEGNNLVIFSQNNGNGKTLWATKLLMSYFNAIWHLDNFSVRGLFINVSRFLFSIKFITNMEDEYVKHIKENILTADLVIWDDIGIKDLTKTEHDYLYGYIDARINAGKSNIYTTNLLGNEFQKTMGNRLYSRVFNGSIKVEFKDKDHRGDNL